MEPLGDTELDRQTEGGRHSNLKDETRPMLAEQTDVGTVPKTGT